VSVKYHGQENQRRSSASGATTAARTAAASRSPSAVTGSAGAAYGFADMGPYDGGQAELVERLDLERNQSKDGRCSAALVEDVGAEASQAFQSERKIELEAFLEAVLLRIGHDAVGQLLGFGRRQLRQVERHQVSVDAHLRRRIGGDMEVAASHLQHSFEQIA